MTGRCLRRDPEAQDGLRLATIESDAGELVLATTSDRRSTTVRLTLSDPTGALGVSVRFHDEWEDWSAQPAAAIGSCFAGAPDPDIEAEFAQVALAWAQERIDGVEAVDPAAGLVLAAHPLLRANSRRGQLEIPGSLPPLASQLLRAPSLRSAIEVLRARPGATRPLVRAVGEVLGGAGILRVRELSLLPAAAGLPEEDAVAIVSVQQPTRAPLAGLSRESSELLGRALQRTGRATHRSVLHAIAASEVGLQMARRIAAAESAGDLDVTGIRGEDAAGWLDARAHEALGLAHPGDHPWGSVHGRRTDDGLRLRLLGRRDELRHAGAAMRNCLGTYGQMATVAGSSLIAAVASDGSLTQAIEVDASGRVQQWLGPRNASVPAAEKAGVESVLVDCGIDPSSPFGWSFDAPF